jgi:DNA primase
LPSGRPRSWVCLRVAMTAVDEVKQKTDILDIISGYVKLTKAGKMYRGLCPFHSEKHGSFFVYPEQQTWHCFGACATGGDVFSFIMKREGLDFGEALRLLARQAGIAFNENPVAQARDKEKDHLYEINRIAAEYYHAALFRPGAAALALGYARQRGLSEKTIGDFELGYSPDAWEEAKKHFTSIGYQEDELVKAGILIRGDDGLTHDRFRGKLMFPVRDERGRVTGFGSRVLDDSVPKYINSPQTDVFDKSACLYGIHLAAPSVRKLDKAIIVEGYMDALIAHQFGVNNVLAAMGTAVTEKQVTTIKRYSRNLFFALDADAAGEEAMAKTAALENLLGTEIRVMRLPPGKDPDEVIKEDINNWTKLEAEAQPVTDYIFDLAAARLNLNTPRDRALMVAKIGPVISRIGDAVRRASYLVKLAGLVKVDEKQLETTIEKNMVKPKGRQVVVPSEEIAGRIRRKIFSSPVEEYLLSLLIQHPDLTTRLGTSNPLTYFEDSANRVILNALITGEENRLKNEIAPEMAEKIDELKARALPDDNLEQKLAGCILTLRERYFRNRELEKEAALALEMENAGLPAAMAKLREQGIDNSLELKQIFFTRANRRSGKGPEDPGKAA